MGDFYLSTVQTEKRSDIHARSLFDDLYNFLERTAPDSRILSVLGSLLEGTFSNLHACILLITCLAPCQGKHQERQHVRLH